MANKYGDVTGCKVDPEQKSALALIHTQLIIYHYIIIFRLIFFAFSVVKFRNETSLARAVEKMDRMLLNDKELKCDSRAICSPPRAKIKREFQSRSRSRSRSRPMKKEHNREKERSRSFSSPRSSPPRGRSASSDSRN